MKNLVILLTLAFSTSLFAADGKGACYADGLALQEQPTEIFDLCKEVYGSSVNDDVVNQVCRNSEPADAYKPISECPRTGFLAGCNFNDDNHPVRLKLYFYKNQTILPKFVEYCRNLGGTAF